MFQQSSALFCIADHIADSRADWTAFKGASRMCDGVNPQTGKEQSSYFLDDHPTMPGWFKGMEKIMKEHGLWPQGGLPVECPGFKCLDGKTNYCCRHLLSISLTLFLRSQHFKKLLRVTTTSVTFNFIEQHWDAAKLKFCAAGKSATNKGMEQKVKDYLDSVELKHIQQQ